MPELHFPWIEVSILLPMFGAIWLYIQRRNPNNLTHAIVICGLTLLLTVGELIDFLIIGSFEAHDHWFSLEWLFHRDLFVVDELSAFQLPLSALIFLVTILSTLKTKAARFSLPLTLISESLLLATFSCRASWPLIVLLILSTIPPWLELRQRGRCTRIYTLHMAAFSILLLVGWGWLTQVDQTSSAALIPGALLTGAALIRSGIFPLHLWIPDLFDKAAFGTSILYTTPLVGAYAVMRLVLPYAPTWALQTIAILSLFTALYAGGMALVQSEARRMFCFLFLSQASLVLIGLELVTPIGLTGALCVWLSVGLSMTGFGITLRSIESRINRISLTQFHGLQRQMPMLAGFFLLTGLAAIGFPATVGFIGMELLIEGAIEVYPLVGTLVVIAAALNGIAVLLAYFRIFTGRSVLTRVPMHARMSERIAVLVLTLLILGGGLYPQPGTATRYHAGKAISDQRQKNPLTVGPVMHHDEEDDHDDETDDEVARDAND
ncbi:NADH-quinone oxidoreductase subunit M [Roseimaritima multifibrata]|uniref:NADH-quinone oxidoreductase subunit M n=1 Tax=Roseimaritima multifibrata TaxID=1930274 RepID=A0A517MNW8_9BACT|nr:proton-conducting transporter membrane subunit [Roseimaritima multifibrata]QDS96569.1 NADH-quinone oxidoreductase subunit M [Roseimaritima multifibrata]